MTFTLTVGLHAISAVFSFAGLFLNVLAIISILKAKEKKSKFDMLMNANIALSHALLSLLILYVDISSSTYKYLVDQPDLCSFQVFGATVLVFSAGSTVFLQAVMFLLTLCTGIQWSTLLTSAAIVIIWISCFLIGLVSMGNFRSGLLYTVQPSQIYCFTDFTNPSGVTYQIILLTVIFTAPVLFFVLYAGIYHKSQNIFLNEDIDAKAVSVITKKIVQRGVSVSFAHAAMFFIIGTIFLMEFLTHQFVNRFVDSVAILVLHMGGIMNGMILFAMDTAARESCLEMFIAVFGPQKLDKELNKQPSILL